MNGIQLFGACTRPSTGLPLCATLEEELAKFDDWSSSALLLDSASTSTASRMYLKLSLGLVNSLRSSNTRTSHIGILLQSRFMDTPTAGVCRPVMIATTVVKLLCRYDFYRGRVRSHLPLEPQSLPMQYERTFRIQSFVLPEPTGPRHWPQIRL